MTNQEFFNNAYRYHVLEGKPLGFDTISAKCSYKEGCAIGCQLPQDLLKDAVESFGITGQPKRILNFFNGVDENLLIDMQGAHDGAARASFNAAKMSRKILTGKTSLIDCNYKEVAKTFKLQIPTV